ncbi:S-type pyocin domain-containing protein [Pseudomonas savastanoi pv. phaseolicola]|uniref:S-type pyocin protein n=3 Tax=Pseudomonas savastanoi TaxID=29438 RepID=A0A3M3FMN1_PSESG|nr:MULTISPECIES: S-type pyocin domain-containing protein [Pseudomonas]AAZ36764.1 S-type pyocin family protein [Pseudomonas savastanoi pv. phaseolicola 1448A]KPB45475.1 S-type pyocin family protein [Pseudomonas savastanoi pv. phaseolicola]KPB45853.1 S-type pyocin family protein [Pseudomonas savastanoi pv. phaseolicola]KPB65139.1 S-type pyocin family protein [Pseudomonas savastanoi pv. phaseolicola]KPB65530.1 S-type pyocin family protein [Pseudomonas amygdali pv. mellea]
MPQNVITLPPTIVTPGQPLPRPLGPLSGAGVIARPLRWDGTIPANHEMDAFFSKRGIRNEQYTISIIVTASSTQRNIDQSYIDFLPLLPADVDAEISAGVGDYPFSELEKSTIEKNVVDSLISQRAAELAKSNEGAHAFFGRHALAVDIKKNAVDFLNIFQTRRDLGSPLDVYKSWEASVTAGYRAKILEEKIRILTERSVSLSHTIAAAQAREDERIAAETESTRLAVEAAEHARLAAETAEQARMEAEAEAQVQRDADEHARVTAEAQALEAGKTLKLQEAATPQLGAVAGVISVTAGSGLFLDATIQAAIEILTALAGTAVSATTAVGIGTLLYSPSLGNGELPGRMLDLPARVLMPDLPDALNDVAATGGTIDMPYRIYGDRSKYSVVATQAEGGFSPRVPVRALTLDPVANAYTFTTSDTPPITLTLPIAAPGNSSTTTVAQPVETPAYAGITLEPIEVKGEPLPGTSQMDIRDAIYVYPLNSGLPPVYVVFNSPYDGATTRGEHSGRMYDPEKAGGPTQNLDWTTASVTQDGIDLVKLHTGRFGASDANTIMIDRLEKILRGELVVTDTDKIFYTHELRELERYRALGVADGVQGNVWNNAHTAALEDYRINENRDFLYTEAAQSAGDRQDHADALRGL